MCSVSIPDEEHCLIMRDWREKKTHIIWQYQLCLIFYIIKPHKKHIRNAKNETTWIPWLLFLFVSFKKLKTFLRISFYFPCKQCECSLLFSSWPQTYNNFCSLNISFHTRKSFYHLILLCVVFCYPLEIKEEKKKISSYILTPCQNELNSFVEL